jgi:hypothetical protein
VDVRLVAGVPDDPVTGRLEDAVNGQRELHDAEVRAEMAAARRTGADQLVPDLAGEGLELGIGEIADVGRRRDLLEQALGDRV